MTQQNEKKEDSKDKPGRLKRAGAPLLIWTLLASIVIHMSPMIALLSVHWRVDTNADFKWFGQMSELTDLGHGAEENRWAAIKTFPKSKKEEPPPEQEKEKLKDSPEEIPEKKNPVEDKPEVKEPVEVKPEKKKLVAKKVKKPKKIKKQGKVQTKRKNEKKVVAKKETTTKPVPKKALPGLQNAGPSNLPNFKNYAPGNARMMALVRVGKFKGTKFESSVVNLLRAVPDYRILLEGQTINPVRKLNAIFMASANPRHLQKTFLAIRHNMSKDEVKATLGKRFDAQVPWVSYRGYPIRPLVPPTSAYKDPRKIMLATSRLAIVTRPEWLKQLTSKPKTEEDIEAALPMIKGLNRIEKAATNSSTLVLISAQGLSFYFPGYGPLPNFQTVRLSIENINRPSLTIDLQFEGELVAKKFVQSCPKLKKGLVSAIPGARFLGLNVYVDKLSCKQTKEYVTIKGTYTQKEVLRAIGLITPFIPRPRALEKLPQPPKPPEPTDPKITNTTKTPKDNNTPSVDPKKVETKTSPSQENPTKTNDKKAPAPKVENKNSGKGLKLPTIPSLKSLIPKKSTKTEDKAIEKKADTKKKEPSKAKEPSDDADKKPTTTAKPESKE